MSLTIRELRNRGRAFETMSNALKTHRKIPAIIRERYVTMLVRRAVRFYLESNLDDLTIAEDLYQCDEFDCSCTQEEADRNKHNKKCEYSDRNHFTNIDYSEKHEDKFFADRK